MKETALDHWEYVKSVLEAHGEDADVIEKCGFHYKTAFEHGWKHGIESELKNGGVRAMDKDSICDIYADGKKVGEFLWKAKNNIRTFSVWRGWW